MKSLLLISMLAMSFSSFAQDKIQELMRASGRGVQLSVIDFSDFTKRVNKQDEVILKLHTGDMEIRHARYTKLQSELQKLQNEIFVLQKIAKGDGLEFKEFYEKQIREKTKAFDLKFNETVLMSKIEEPKEFIFKGSDLKGMKKFVEAEQSKGGRVVQVLCKRKSISKLAGLKLPLFTLASSGVALSGALVAQFSKSENRLNQSDRNIIADKESSSYIKKIEGKKVKNQ
jgi:hypothetical protein